METDFIRRILDHGPPRPLILAGYSLGGFVAWAIAKRLAETGHCVDDLFILDVDSKQLVPMVTHASLTTRVGRLLGNVATMLHAGGSAETTRMLGEFIGYRLVDHPLLLRLLARFRHLRLPPGLRYRIRFSLGGELQARIVRDWQIGEAALPALLEGSKVVVFRAAAEHEHDEQAGSGWRERCADVSIEDAAGDHHTMLSERSPHSLHNRLPERLGLGVRPLTD